MMDQNVSHPPADWPGTRDEWRVLQALNAAGKATPNELAERLGLDVESVVGILECLGGGEPIAVATIGEPDERPCAVKGCKWTSTIPYINAYGDRHHFCDDHIKEGARFINASEPTPTLQTNPALAVASLEIGQLKRRWHDACAQLELCAAQHPTSSDAERQRAATEARQYLDQNADALLAVAVELGEISMNAQIPF